MGKWGSPSEVNIDPWTSTMEDCLGKYLNFSDFSLMYLRQAPGLGPIDDVFRSCNPSSCCLSCHV